MDSSSGNEKPYANFKLHFTEAHLDLQATDATTNKLCYHSANTVVQQIVEHLRVAACDETPPEPPMQFPGIPQNLPSVTPPAIDYSPSIALPDTNAIVTEDPCITQMVEYLM